MKVKSFKYEAYNQNKVIEKGVITASSRQEAVIMLQSRSLTPIKVEEEKKSSAKLFSERKIKKQDLIDFTESLSTLISANIPLDRALQMIISTTQKKTMRHLLETLLRQVKGGSSLAEALLQFPEVFPRVYIYMIRAGEENGILEILLPKLEQLLAEEEETRSKLISALIYPVILGVVGVGSVIMLLIFIIPKFAVVFEDTGTQLPASTAFLLGLSALLRQYGWILLLAPFLLLILMSKIKQSEDFRAKADSKLLAIPIVGDLIILRECTGFSRTISALLEAGLPLVRALSTAGTTIGNTVLRNKIVIIEEDVRKGMSMAQSFAKHNIFPDIMAKLISIGEESGQVSTIFQKIATSFDKKAKKQTERLVGLLEPFMILFLGVLVGGIVVIMLSSIMSMNDIGM